MVTINRGNSTGPEHEREPTGSGYDSSRPYEDWENDFLKDRDERQRAFYEALRKAFEDDINREVLEKTTLFDDLYKNFKAFDGDPMVFRSETTGNKYNVTRDSISYDDADGKFTFADAYEMAKFAALDKDMQRKGVWLDGSRKERALLQKAIEEVNKGLPEDQQIKINNKLAVNPHFILAQSQATAYFAQHGRGFGPVGSGPGRGTENDQNTGPEGGGDDPRGDGPGDGDKDSTTGATGDDAEAERTRREQDAEAERARREQEAREERERQERAEREAEEERVRQEAEAERTRQEQARRDEQARHRGSQNNGDHRGWHQGTENTGSPEDERLREEFKKAVQPESMANGSRLQFAFSNETIVRMRQALKAIHSDIAQNTANGTVDTALMVQFKKAAANSRQDGLIIKLVEKLNFVYGDGAYDAQEMIRTFKSRQTARKSGPRADSGVA